MVRVISLNKQQSLELIKFVKVSTGAIQYSGEKMWRGFIYELRKGRRLFVSDPEYINADQAHVDMRNIINSIKTK